MTKVYVSNDNYEVYFDEGTMVILSEANIDELVAESEYVDELKEDLGIANIELNALYKSIKLLSLLPERFSNIIKGVRRRIPREQLETVNDELEHILDEIDI